MNIVIVYILVIVNIVIIVDIVTVAIMIIMNIAIVIIVNIAIVNIVIIVHIDIVIMILVISSIMIINVMTHSSTMIIYLMIKMIIVRFAMHIVNGAGSAPHQEQPELVNKHIAKFIKGESNAHDQKCLVIMLFTNLNITICRRRANLHVWLVTMI